MANLNRFVSVEEAKSAVYIDFEGFGKSRNGDIPVPHLLGAWCNGKNNKLYLLQDHLKPLCRPLAVSKHWANRPVMSMDGAIRDLIEWSTQENRLLLYFSEHEERVIAQHCTKQVFKDFLKHSKNAKLTVNRWHKKVRRGKPRAMTLKCYFAYTNHDNHTSADYKMADNLRKIDIAVSKVTRWSKLSNPIKKRWETLVVYNLHDCKGLKKLTKKAANGLKVKGLGD